MSKQIVLSQFDKMFCSACGLPRREDDFALTDANLQCRCFPIRNRGVARLLELALGVQPVYRKESVRDDWFIERFVTDAPFIFGEPFGVIHETPLGFGTHLAPQQEAAGLCCLVTDETLKKIVGYCFLYEVDYPLKEILQHEPEMRLLAQHIADRTGSCILARSQGGWHFASLNIIPLTLFKELYQECEKLAPSNFALIDVRISPKPNEHLMNRFQQFYTAKSVYPISTFHKSVWELALNVKLTGQQREQDDTFGVIVKYVIWRS